MSARSRGFTVLEMLMVIMLLGVLARMVVGVIPESKAQEPLLRLQESVDWAWQQARLEGRVWKIQLSPRSWQLFTLTGQQTALPGPLPYTFWQEATGSLAQGKVAEGEFRLEGGTPLSDTLWFLPDGDISHKAVTYRAADGNEQRLTLGAANPGANAP